MEYKKITQTNVNEQGVSEIDCIYRECGKCSKNGYDCRNFCPWFLEQAIKRLSMFEEMLN